jgi:hypothetical protein
MKSDTSSESCLRCLATCLSVVTSAPHIAIHSSQLNIYGRPVEPLHIKAYRVGATGRLGWGFRCSKQSWLCQVRCEHRFLKTGSGTASAANSGMDAATVLHDAPIPLSTCSSAGSLGRAFAASALAREIVQLAASARSPPRRQQACKHEVAARGRGEAFVVPGRRHLRCG